MQPETVSIEIGKTSQLTPTVSPVDADDLTVSYDSSDVTIATVDDKGMVTGIKAGTATITVKTTDGEFTAKSVITVVTPKKPVTGITLNQKTATAKVGDKKSLTVTIEPADADKLTVTWKSSDATIATVDASGNVTAIAEGSSTITATTDDGGFTAECIFTITAAA
ncbi:hypothetical protein LABALGNA3A7_09730 [Dellaglioa algida]|nr:hypothetical protein LABALGNA3A7_09730 [Dellaglioa algida]